MAIQDYQLAFHQSLYFIVVTFTTVGYGDFSPKTVDGQMVMIVFIVVSFLVIPYQISQLWALYSTTSEYSGKTRRKDHFMLSGNITPESVSVCLSQLYYKGHNNQDIKTVILGATEPSLELIDILRFPFYRYHVNYLKGSLTINNDLQRACAQNASACFILTNKYGKPDEEDAATVMRAIAMKKYNNDAQVIVQLNSIVNKSPLQAEGIRYITCIDELKLNAMAHSCLCPGFLALLTNLLFMHHVPTKERERMSEWEKEYADGLEYGFYFVPFSHYFFGMTFNDACRLIYEELDIILFAIAAANDENKQVVLLNPGNAYAIQPTDIAYMICRNSNSAQRVENFHLDHPSIPAQARSSVEFDRSYVDLIEERQPLITNERKHFREPKPITRSKSDKGKREKQERKRKDSTEIAIMEDDDADDESWHRPPPSELLKQSRPYYMLKTARTLEQATLLHLGDIKDHIVVVGTLRGIAQFVLHLRLKAMEYRPIVIIHRKSLSPKNWQKLHKFPNIFFIRGSGLDRTDLKRASLRTAHTAVVLRHTLSSSFTKDELPTADSLTIMTALAIQHEARNRDIKILVELVLQENMRFLQKAPTSLYNFQFSPEFAAGNLYWASCLDSLTCQAYYNSNLITIVEQFISAQPSPTGCHVYQIDMPLSMEGKTYKELFRFLVEKYAAIPLGLYRSPATHNAAMPYVYTSPSSTVELHEEDKIFILGTCSPSIEE